MNIAKIGKKEPHKAMEGIVDETSKRDSILALEALLNFKRGPIISLKKQKESQVVNGTEDSSNINVNHYLSPSSKYAPLPDKPPADSLKYGSAPRLIEASQSPVQNASTSQANLENVAMHTVGQQQASPVNGVMALSPQYSISAHTPYHLLPTRQIDDFNMASSLLHFQRSEAAVLPLVMFKHIAAAQQAILRHAVCHGSTNIATAQRNISQQSVPMSTTACDPALPAPRPIVLKNLNPIDFTSAFIDNKNASKTVPGTLPKTHLPAFSNFENRLDSPDPHGHDVSKPSKTEQKDVRREQIEEALRSKPQRGRKRENLNVKERMELTRTRNREHAKCTRIRKKARYEELVKNESKYFNVQKKEDLAKARRDNVSKFLSLWTALLIGSCDRSWILSSEENTSSGKSHGRKDTLSKRPKITRSWDKREEALLNKNGESRVAENLEDIITKSSMVESFGDVVEDCNHFKFSHICRHQSATTGIASLLKFESNIVNQMSYEHGVESISFLQYRVVGTSDNVALTHNNSGFAEFELVLQGTQKRSECVLLVGIMKVEFAGNSPKLQSLRWHSTFPSDLSHEEEMDNGKGLPSPLKDQTAHPSVVSFYHPASEDSALKPAFSQGLAISNSAPKIVCHESNNRNLAVTS